MKNRLLSEIIAAALILSLAGCAESPSADSRAGSADNTEADSVSSTVSTDPAADPVSSYADNSSSQDSAFGKYAKISTENEEGLLSNMKLQMELTHLDHDESDNTWSSNSEEFKKFTPIMKREIIKSPDLKGVYLLATDDEILFLGGINSVDKNGAKVDAFTTYEIGSVTKTFTAVCVLQLVEQGKLAFEDTLDKFFPEIANAKNINIGALLCMRSGLQREFIPDSAFGDADNVNTEVLKRFYTDGYSDEELIKELSAAELLFAPGTEARYSNAGYTLLAMIVEKISGLSYAEYVQKNIFDVCGMEHSSSMKTDDLTSVPEPPPKDYYPFFDFAEIFPDGFSKDANTSRGAGDIHSCAFDMLLFDRALAGGRLIGEDMLDKMFSINRENPYCCGWQSYTVSVRASDKINSAYFHAGGTPSYCSMNLYVPSKKYGNLYLVQLHSNVADQRYLEACAASVIMASKT